MYLLIYLFVVFCVSFACVISFCFLFFVVFLCISTLLTIFTFFCIASSEELKSPRQTGVYREICTSVAGLKVR